MNPSDDNDINWQPTSDYKAAKKRQAKLKTIIRIIDKLKEVFTSNLKKSFESKRGVPKNSKPSSKISSSDIYFLIILLIKICFFLNLFLLIESSICIVVKQYLLSLIG